MSIADRSPILFVSRAKAVIRAARLGKHARVYRVWNGRFMVEFA